MKKSLKKGFTLIELLVVIAIIGILATIVIVNVANARVKATKAKVASDLAAGSKIYSACVTFGGTATKGTAAGTICDSTNISDATEKATTQGSWPTLPSGFTYTAAAGLGANDITGVTAAASSGGGTYTCTTTGCTGNAW